MAEPFVSFPWTVEGHQVVHIYADDEVGEDTRQRIIVKWQRTVLGLDSFDVLKDFAKAVAVDLGLRAQVTSGPDHGDPLGIVVSVAYVPGTVD